MRAALEAVQAEYHEARTGEEVCAILNSLPSPMYVAGMADLPFELDLKSTAASPDDAATGIVLARLAVRKTGTLLLDGGETASLLPDVSVVFVVPSMVVETMGDLIDYVARHPEEHLVTATGPSRTADIEKTLVLGAHGPRRLVVILMKS